MSKAKSSASSQAAFESPESYEAGIAELEGLLARLEGGDMPLDHLLSAYERGAGLLAFCRARLEAVENQVKVLDDRVLKTWTPQ